MLALPVPSSAPARWIGVLLVCSGASATLPSPGATQEMGFEEYEPRSTLVVPEHPTPRAKFPFVDVHSHHGRVPDGAYVESLIRAMDGMNMAVLVNLSGGSGPRLARMVEAMEGRHPGRFAVFANVDFDGIGRPGWGARAAAQLAEDVGNGARGLKIYKSLGLSVTDIEGRRVPVDDPRIDPVWAMAGELGIPVLIHSGDPAPFWEPHDRFNERWLELKQRPGRKRGPNDPAPWEQIMAEQHRVFRKHPETTFINAHLGWMGNDLGRLSRLLDDLPNVHVGIGAVLAELGRQPRFARRFFIEHQDRILFGKDAWAPEEYPVYFRTLETADEYFDYYRDRHAFWKLYGLDLPDTVLRKVYYENALRIIPGLDESLFPGG